jgi:hypothetical protein
MTDSSSVKFFAIDKTCSCTSFVCTKSVVDLNFCCSMSLMMWYETDIMLSLNSYKQWYSHKTGIISFFYCFHVQMFASGDTVFSCCFGCLFAHPDTFCNIASFCTSTSFIDMICHFYCEGSPTLAQILAIYTVVSQPAPPLPSSIPTSIFILWHIYAMKEL